MLFQVPQFIEIEDKIFGPLTFKQFLYVGGGVGMLVTFYILLPFVIFLIFGIPIAVFSSALAFYRINDKPFIYTLEAAIKYFKNAKLYIWKKSKKEIKQKKETIDINARGIIDLPKMEKHSTSKLKNIAWSLDVEESLYSSQQDNK